MAQSVKQRLWSLRNLTKRQKRFIFCLLIFCVFCLFGFLNAYAVNNPTWLEGTWSNKSEQYSIMAKNDDHKYWNIRQNGYILMKNAKISASSSKDKIVLTREDSQTEYHISKLDKEQLEMHIFNNKKKIKTMKLQKVEWFFVLLNLWDKNIAIYLFFFKNLITIKKVRIKTAFLTSNFSF